MIETCSSNVRMPTWTSAISCK